MELLVFEGKGERAAGHACGSWVVGKLVPPTEIWWGRGDGA